MLPSPFSLTPGLHCSSVFSPPLDEGSADVAWTRLVEVGGFSESSFKAPTESTAAEFCAKQTQAISHTRWTYGGDMRIHTMDEYL